MSKPVLVESGTHLAIVRGFIQTHAINGSDVTWGSSDLLHFSGVTVEDLERLAQRIVDSVHHEISKNALAALRQQFLSRGCLK